MVLPDVHDRRETNSVGGAGTRRATCGSEAKVEVKGKMKAGDTH